MGRVAGVFDNPPGFPCTPPGVDILEGGKLTSNNVAGSSHDPLQSPAVASGAVSKPGGDTAGQDALHSAGVEGPEDSSEEVAIFHSNFHECLFGLYGLDKECLFSDNASLVITSCQ